MLACAAMKTFLFVAFVVACSAAGFWTARRRWLTYQSESAARDQAQALALATWRQSGVAPVAPRPPAPAPVDTPSRARTTGATTPSAAAPIVSTPSPTARPAQTASAPPTLDAAWLRMLKPSRFARMCIAYFEATGVRVQRHDRETGVDALLFAGASKSPLMAVRWSRSADHPTGSNDIGRFADAAHGLGLIHTTFVAQAGVTLNATRLAIERSVTIMSAEQLAAKIAALPAHQRTALVKAAHALTADGAAMSAPAAERAPS